MPRKTSHVGTAPQVETVHQKPSSMALASKPQDTRTLTVGPPKYEDTHRTEFGQTLWQ